MGPTHLVTALLVAAAVASGVLAVSVSGDETTVRTAGATAPGDGSVATPLLGQDGQAAAQRQAIAADARTSETVPTANATDSDGDGLADSTERRLGTDLEDPDTDGDGIIDGAEVHATELYPDADPLQQDIYVEVDAVGDNRLSAGTIARIETTFADAPVPNPNGEDGIDVHIVVNDRGLAANETVYSHERPGERDDMYDFRDAHFDARGAGYYYVILADDVAYDGDPKYVGAGRRGVVAMQTFETPELTASLFMHELGHAFGLNAGAEGIDSERYTAQEYDSVMNYNGLYEQLDYSDGTDAVGRDEWAFVANERYRPEGAYADENS